MVDRADLIVRSATILTPSVVEGGAAEVEFVAIRDGQIVGLGSEADRENWTAEREIDLGAGVLSPGFIDAHIHPIGGLDMTRGVDLSGIRSRGALQTVLREHLASSPPSAWIFGWGLDPAAMDDSFDNTILDGIAQDRLVYITLFDGHGVVVSDAALALAGVTGNESFNDASVVAVDATGRPTGVLFEMSATQLVGAHLPPLDFDERVNGLLQILDAMAQSGLVAGQMLDLAAPDSLEVLEAAEEIGDLAIRLRVSPWLMPGFSDSELESMAEMQTRHGRRWHVHGVKLLIDGSIDNGTAWLFEPDSHGESTRSLWLEPDEYRRAVAWLDERGIPTATHAIGDQGVSFVAATLAELPDGGPQHRIEHIEILPDRVLEEIRNSGATASMQPTHCTLYTRADHADNWSQRLGDERANLAWRVGALRESGVVVALGSDWPIASYDPRIIFAAAQLRRQPGDANTTPNQPSEGLSVRRALEGYTSQYWESVGEPGGRIEVGARADFTAFDRNPLTTDPDEFAQATVLLTVVDGEVVVDAAQH